MAWVLTLSPMILQTMALESPTLMQKSFWPKVIMLTQVLPENLISRFELNNSSLQFKKALLNAMQHSSVLSIVFYCFC